jgi:6-phosphofructokinase
LGSGGVVLNLGSAVIMPEVFLKALAVARNLGHAVRDFTTANFDMIQHYRPGVNVVRRPVLAGGRGYAITGHHEIMIPLLAAAIYEYVREADSGESSREQ